MGSQKPTLSEDFVATCIAATSVTFGLRRNFRELVNEVLSVTWELQQMAPDDTKVSTLAFYAAKRVRSNRQFSEDVRSLDSIHRRNAERESDEPDRIPNDLRNPADVAGLRIDFEEFRDTLNDQNRKILDAVLMGDSTSELSDKFNLSRARISQIRRVLHEMLQDWLA